MVKSVESGAGKSSSSGKRMPVSLGKRLPTASTSTAQPSMGMRNPPLSSRRNILLIKERVRWMADNAEQLFGILDCLQQVSAAVEMSE